MMKLSVAANAMAGQLQGGDVRFKAVSTDTRTIQIGDLFVALRGENFDAANFVAQARQSGAIAAVVNQDSEALCAELIAEKFPLIFVDNTMWALGKLAAYWRHQFPIPIVAVTGSNGKTTVKEFIASILREAAGQDEAVLATQGNLNNEIGVPLTLLRLRPQHRFAVVEMGMNHAGEIEYLSQLTNPDVAVINNASGAHLEGLGSVEGVARAKGEVLSGLADHGTAIINADDDYADLWLGLAGTHEVLTFGLHQEADIAANWRTDVSGSEVDLDTPEGEVTVSLKLPGQHNVYNALAATTVAVALKFPLDTIAIGLSRFSGVSGRMQRLIGKHGAIVINDAYNANPASLKAAIQVLASMSGKRILVLGDMGELGERAADLHAEMGREARLAGIDHLYALGELTRQSVQEFGSAGQHFEQLEALQAVLNEQLKADVTILVKGSRFMKMERVVQFCTQE